MQLMHHRRQLKPSLSLNIYENNRCLLRNLRSTRTHSMGRMQSFLTLQQLAHRLLKNLSQIETFHMWCSVNKTGITAHQGKLVRCVHRESVDLAIL